MAITITKETLSHAKQTMALLPACPPSQRINLLRSAGIKMNASDIAFANQAGSNELAKISWQVYSNRTTSEIVSVTAPLTEFSTDISPDMADLVPEGVQAKVYFPVIESVGEAKKNKTAPYGSSALKTRYVEASLNRYEVEFELTAWDLAAGNRIEDKVNPAALTAYAMWYKDILAGIKAANPKALTVPGVDTDGNGQYVDNLNHFGPRYIAHRLSPEILPYVDSLVLTPEFEATTQPYNILGLKRERGTYGVGVVGRSMYMDTLGANAVGFMGNRTGLGIGARSPQIIEMGDTRVFPLTTVEDHGIPMVIKQWYSGNDETVKMSVILLATSAVLSPKFLRVLNTASA